MDDFKNFECDDCGVNTHYNHEYYMLLDDLWMQIYGPSYGMLCIGCAEQRLGRTLNKQDFKDVPINHIDGWAKSERFIDRLTIG